MIVIYLSVIRYSPPPGVIGNTEGCRFWQDTHTIQLKWGCIWLYATANPYEKLCIHLNKHKYMFSTIHRDHRIISTISLGSIISISPQIYTPNELSSMRKKKKTQTRLQSILLKFDHTNNYQLCY